MPWKLLGTYGSYIFGWLVGYSGLLGPIAGIMIADYFIVRKRVLKVDDLYRRGGEYEYRNGCQSASAGEPGARHRGGAAGARAFRRCAGFTTMPGSSDSRSPARVYMLG